MAMKLPIYLDNNATTPVDPRVLEAMIPYFTNQFGNAASRTHAYGWAAEGAVDHAREILANLIGAEPKEIIFTSGSTEAINLALKGAYEAYVNKGNHFITCVAEHKAVLDTFKHLEKLGAEVTYLNIDGNGLIDLEDLKSAIRPDTILISVMHANNETGVIQPIAEISEIAKKYEVLFFTDATQSVGKIEIDVNKYGVDMLCFSAHKIYGPKGVGALYVRRKNPRVKLISQIDGGGHERGMRSGTLNVPGIVGFGKAGEICKQEMNKEGRLLKLRNRLENEILKIEETSVNGSRLHRMPHVTNISFGYIDGDNLMMGINKNIAISAGSACTSASMEPSHVLKAMGLGDSLAHSSLRFSLGRFNNEEEIEFTINEVRNAVDRLRNNSPLWDMFKEGELINSSEWSHPA